MQTPQSAHAQPGWVGARRPRAPTVAPRTPRAVTPPTRRARSTRPPRCVPRVISEYVKTHPKTPNPSDVPAAKWAVRGGRARGLCAGGGASSSSPTMSRGVALTSAGSTGAVLWKMSAYGITQWAVRGGRAQRYNHSICPAPPLPTIHAVGLRSRSPRRVAPQSIWPGATLCRRGPAPVWHRSIATLALLFAPANQGSEVHHSVCSVDPPFSERRCECRRPPSEISGVRTSGGNLAEGPLCRAAPTRAPGFGVSEPAGGAQFGNWQFAAPHFVFFTCK